MTPVRLVPAALFLYAGMTAAAWLWRITLDGESPFFVPRPSAGVHPVRDVGAGLVTALVIVVLSRGLTRRTRAGAALAERLADVLGPLRTGQILILAAASGIGEELFFRGALQPRVGLVVASLVFGLAHLVPTRPLALWSVFAVAAGLVFGVLFERTGNLLAPIVAHVTVNAANLHWLVRRRAPAPDGGSHSRN